MTEIVAGIRDRDEESAEQCARRELREEAGYTAAELVFLGAVYPSPGYITERIDLFAARLQGPAGETELDHDEELYAIEVAPDRFREMVRQGEIQDGKTLAAWALFQAKGLDRRWLKEEKE